MNKAIALLCIAMYAGLIICAQGYSEDDLYRTEKTCNLNAYVQVLNERQVIHQFDW